MIKKGIDSGGGEGGEGGDAQRGGNATVEGKKPDGEFVIRISRGTTKRIFVVLASIAALSGAIGAGYFAGKSDPKGERQGLKNVKKDGKASATDEDIVHRGKDKNAPPVAGINALGTAMAETVRLGNKAISAGFSEARELYQEFKGWKNDLTDLPEYDELKGYFIRPLGLDHSDDRKLDVSDNKVATVAKLDVKAACITLRMAQLKAFYQLAERELENISHLQSTTIDNKYLEDLNAKIARLEVACGQSPKNRFLADQLELAKKEKLQLLGGTKRPMPCTRIVNFPPESSDRIAQIYFDESRRVEINVPLTLEMLEDHLKPYNKSMNFYKDELKKIGYWKSVALLGDEEDENKRNRLFPKASQDVVENNSRIIEERLERLISDLESKGLKPVDGTLVPMTNLFRDRQL